MKFRPTRVRRFSEAQRCLEGSGADVLLVDLCLLDACGMEVVSAAQRVAPGVPVVVLSGEADDLLAAEVLQHGAQDFLVKRGLRDNELVRALLYAIARQRMHSSLRNLSLIDELTGLYNRRGFLALADQELKAAARQGLHSNLIFADVDGLKQINDSFGHREVDRALEQIAQVFRQCFRESDIAALFGGNEFCALLINVSQTSMKMIRKRVERALQAGNARGQNQFHVSISMGIVEIGTSYAKSGVEQQIARADSWMYAEKRGKRMRRCENLEQLPAVRLPEVASTSASLIGALRK